TRKALGAERLERDRVTGLEPLLEIGEVHGLCVGPERLERHRLLHVRTAQLAHPHVNWVLATLEPRPLLGSRARAVALLAATRGLAGAGSLAAPNALAVLLRTGRRLQVVEPDPLFSGFFRLAHARLPSTSTRGRTLWMMPRICGVSLISTVWPILRSPSERSVSSCRLSDPLRDLCC